ncbi:MAG: bifunctional riboflavin kinase/FAD synthetase [Planctomycetota bacterium]
MTVIYGLESVDLAGVVLTIGNFDGVHRGHQAIIAAGRKQAQAQNTQMVAMTFHPHPAAILTPQRIPGSLTTLEQKIALLQNAGAEYVVVAQSKPEFFIISANEFITDVIMAKFKPKIIVEGASFRFGKRRQGNVETLAQAAETYGFDVQIIEPVNVALSGPAETPISSSLIRNLVSSGTVDQAAICLGRPFTLIGPVVPGVGRGKKLGFPTANLKIESQLIPAEGIYAGRAEIDNQPHPAAISIGRYPTFEGSDLMIEAHLLDFAGQIYNQTIRLQFHEWIRPQKKFDSPKILAQQIARDVDQTRKTITGNRILNN